MDKDKLKCEICNRFMNTCLCHSCEFKLRVKLSDVLASENQAAEKRISELEVELKDSSLSFQSQQVEIGRLKAKVTDLELTIIRALGMCAVEPDFDSWHIADYLEQALAGRKDG